jgi:hypothetical protein
MIMIVIVIVMIVVTNLVTQAILLHWFNFHLKRGGHVRQVRNFSSDLSDSECYIWLFSQIAPHVVTMGDVEGVLRERDLERRGELVIQYATKMDCNQFISPKDIVEGTLPPPCTPLMLIR